MSRYKLIAFDMDGTLLTDSKELLPGSIAAIREACAAGKTVAIASGRCVSGIVHREKYLPEVRYAICMNGAMVYDYHEKRIVHASPIAPEIIERLIEVSYTLDSMALPMSEYVHIDREKLEHIEEYYGTPYKELFAATAIQQEDFCKTYAATPMPIYKYDVFCRSVEDRIKLHEMLRGLPVIVSDCEVCAVEITNAGVSKGSGLEALCTHLGISTDEAIAVGDANNDVAMIRTAGLGVAMGNANKNARTAADVVVGDNESGGCEEAIRRYLL